MMGGGPFRPDRFGLLHRSVESVHFSDTVGSGFAGRALVGATVVFTCSLLFSDELMGRLEQERMQLLLEVLLRVSIILLIGL